MVSCLNGLKDFKRNCVTPFSPETVAQFLHAVIVDNGQLIVFFFTSCSNYSALNISTGKEKWIGLTNKKKFNQQNGNIYQTYPSHRSIHDNRENIYSQWVATYARVLYSHWIVTTHENAITKRTWIGADLLFPAFLCCTQINNRFWITFRISNFSHILKCTCENCNSTHIHLYVNAFAVKLLPFAAHQRHFVLLLRSNVSFVFHRFKREKNEFR